MKALPSFFLLLVVLFSISADEMEKCNHKILICGVCRNIETHFERNIKNVEELGSCFLDYQVIFYENNSTDNTKVLLSEWASENGHVTLLSEDLSTDEMPPSRTEKIARARNIVLSVARDPKYADYEYLLMADLDSANPWPVEAIIETIDSPREWDCVAANDLYLIGYYRDRYSFRDQRFPLGPEMIGNIWWWELVRSWFKIPEGGDWLPVYSAFGGLAIYKTQSILPFSYSGVVTEDLRNYYSIIFPTIPRKHFHRTVYLSLLDKAEKKNARDVPIVFRQNTAKEAVKGYIPVTVCEHVTLHAAMATHGYGKFFINPKMKVAFN